MVMKIIAEVGVNHNGSLLKAKKYIDICKSIGVDYVKFQLAIPSLVVTNSASKANYQKMISNKNETQLDMLKKVHLSLSEYKKLFLYSKNKKIDLIFSAFDQKSLKFLIKLNPKILKIPSGEIDNFLDLRFLKNYKGKILISSGMCEIKDIEELIFFLKSIKIKKSQIVLMHCNSDYPTKYRDVNLNVLDDFKKKYNFDLGYSDHTTDDIVGIACAVKKINFFEKHITFSQKLSGPDHKASMEVNEFKKMILRIRSIEKCLGKSTKKVTKSEILNKKHVRKSLRLNKNIKKGQKITFEDIISMRPADGVSPKLFNNYINKVAKKNYSKFDKI